jgi:predicted transposase YbfD/YdcC
LSENLAEKILGQGGDYLLALKGNQSSLYEDVERHFEQPTTSSWAKMSVAETLDKGHGRIEIRRCRLSTDMEWLQPRHPEWNHLNSIIAVESERHLGETVSPETRYFISSSLTAAPCMLAAVRLPWGIDNQRHGVLDLSFGEDHSRIRRGNAPTKIGIIRHAAWNMIKPTKPKRVSIKGMRKVAGWDNATLTTILAQIF